MWYVRDAGKQWSNIVSNDFYDLKQVISLMCLLDVLAKE